MCIIHIFYNNLKYFLTYGLVYPHLVNNVFINTVKQIK